MTGTNMTMQLDRRRFLAFMGAGAAAMSAPAVLRAAAPRLALYGPPAGPSITLAHAVNSGALADLAGEVTLTVWRNPDELRAGLTSGSIDLSVVPVQAATNLYNRGIGLRLVNVMTRGLYYIVANDGTISSLADLSGKRLAVPFVNDTPDFVMRALIARHGLTPDRIAAGSPTEAAQMLLAGRIDAALLAEPAASMAILRSRQAGAPMVRAVDIQAEWGAITGLGPVVPQAGLAVTEAFAASHGDLIAPLQAALVEATAEVLVDPEAAAAAASGPMDMPQPVLAASIPHCNLTATPASEARPAIEAMLRLMAETDTAILGGGLPDDGFYLL